MPRYEKLSPEELEAIRRFIEEADKVDLVNPSELEGLRALVKLHWPHLLHKLPPPHTALAIKLLESAPLSAPGWRL